MAKKLILVAGVTVTAAALVFVGLAFAQTPTPPADGATAVPGWGMMRGFGGGMGHGRTYTDTLPMGPGYGRGGMMGGWMQGRVTAGTGLLQDYLLDAFAAALDLPRATLDERVAAGETLYDIAVAQGLNQADFVTLMQTARDTALDQAVADGVLTQEQADWMRNRGGMLAGGRPGYGRGGMLGGGMMGGGPRSGYGMMGGLGRGAGVLHDYMLDAFAAALDLPRATLDERVAAGETLYDIAVAQGLNQADFVTLMQTARDTALDQAVADGVLTQEQADWMRNRGQPGDCPHGAPLEATPAPTN